MRQLEFFPFPRTISKTAGPKEWKVVALRGCPLPMKRAICDTPSAAAAHWHEHIVHHPYYSPDIACFIVLHLDVRRRITGHHLVGMGILDSVLVYPREVFRAAIVAAAYAIVAQHNHPSGHHAVLGGHPYHTRTHPR